MADLFRRGPMAGFSWVKTKYIKSCGVCMKQHNGAPCLDEINCIQKKTLKEETK